MIEGALCVALFVVLSYLPLYRMPQGGSLTLDLVPLIIFAWRRGAGWGCGAGTLAGVLHMMLGGFVVHPLQILLDFPLAYASMGLAGFRSIRKPMGLVLAGFSEAACHILSGVLFFSSYAPKGMNPWIYSTVYNLTFFLPKMLICGIATWIIWKKLERFSPN